MECMGLVCCFHVVVSLLGSVSISVGDVYI